MDRSVRLLVAIAAAAAGLPGCETPEPRPPLVTAVHQHDLAGARELLDRGEDPNYIDKWGYTPLGSAARSGQVELARLLVSRGADIPAAVANCEEIVRWGVENGNTAVEAEGRRGLAVLRMLASQRAETAQREQALAVERERVQLVQEMLGVAASAKTQAPPAYSSDVDEPSYRLPERPEDVAIVVSVGRYSDLPEARFAERDGEAVKRHLLALGFPSRNVVHLSGEKAGYKGIEKFVETWLPKNAEERGRVFFYFSGHGAPDPRSGRAYLLPYDGDPDFLENTGYPLERLYQKLSALKAREVVVALDACFSGAGGRSQLAKGARPLVTKVADAGVPDKLTVFAAASADQITTTLEDQGHGTFTYYFLKGLSGGAKSAEGVISSQGLFEYLEPKVRDAARRQNRDQSPVLRSGEDRALARF